MRQRSIAGVIFGIAALLASPSFVHAAIIPGAYNARSVVDSVDGKTYNFQVFVPAGYNSSQKYPLIMFLHGSGEKGSNNTSQLSVGLGQYITPNAGTFPAITVFPQMPVTCGDNPTPTCTPPAAGAPGSATGNTHLAMEELAKAESEFSFDPNRIYLTGLSAGGFMDWEIAYDNPNTFAAMVPFSGDLASVYFTGDKTAPLSSSLSLVVPRLKSLPIWMEIGSLDTTVSVPDNRSIYQAFVNAGAPIKYTEQAGYGHGGWDVWYSDPNLWSWLFAQSKGGNAGNTGGTTTIAPTGTVVTVMPSTTYQTIQGWEGTSQIGNTTDCSLASPQAAVLDKAVNELGLTRVRLEIKSTAEGVSDNNDPNVINLAGFNFTELDKEIDTIVVPMRQRLAANGAHLYVNLNFVAFRGAGSVQTNPAEYAEFMLATFQHMQSKYGFVPDAIEPILEPENGTLWTPTMIGQDIVATGNRLAAAGFHPDFIAPSVELAQNAISYTNAIVAVPGAQQYLKQLSYHLYGDKSISGKQAIAARGAQLGIQTAQLEAGGSSMQDLWDDLRYANVSAWQQYTIAYCQSSGTLPGYQYYTFDPIASNPNLRISDNARYMPQIMKFVRPGAVRLGTNGILDSLSFRNTNGMYAVVVHTTGSQSISVTGLPAGTYGITYTTPSAFLTNLPDQSISTGSAINVTMPASGYLTIYGKSNVVPVPIPLPTPTPTPIPTPAPSPAPSTKFSVGQKVITTANLNVRSSASASASLVGTKSTGTVGTIVSGGTYADGYYWWNVNYEGSVDGWSVEDYLTSYVAPTPTPTPAPSPVTTPSPETTPTSVPTVTFTLSPTMVTAGQYTNLTVSSSNASTCTVSGGWWSNSGIDKSWTHAYYVTQTTTFTVTCTNNVGSTSKNATVTVVSDQTTPTPPAAPTPTPTPTPTPAPDTTSSAPTVTFTINPTTVASGQYTDLTVSSSNASTCTVSGGGWWSNSPIDKNWTHAYYVTQTSTFTATCTNSAGSTSKNATVTVGPANTSNSDTTNTTQPASNAPTVTLTANHTTITSGQAVVFTWNVTNATSCIASGGGWDGSKDAGTGSHSQERHPTATKTYILTCSNTAGQSASASVTVAVSGSAQSTDQFAQIAGILAAIQALLAELK